MTFQRNPVTNRLQLTLTDSLGAWVTVYDAPRGAVIITVGEEDGHQHHIILQVGKAAILRDFFDVLSDTTYRDERERNTTLDFGGDRITRDDFIDTHFPRRKPTATPGVYELPDGTFLSVQQDQVSFLATCAHGEKRMGCARCINASEGDRAEYAS